MRRADVRSGILIILVSLAFLLSSLRMPWGIYGYEWFAGPGFVPLVLSSVLALLGAILLVRGLRGSSIYREIEQSSEGRQPEAGPEPAGASVARHHRSVLGDQLYRAVMVVAFCALYVFVLLGRLPYWLATTVFVAGFICGFKGGSLLKGIVVGAITSAAVIVVFSRIFGVVLP